MRAADPVHNVELRRDSQGHDSVVFAFPYRPDIVDAVRAIPGRRFDWEAKEWWAPRADAIAPFVKGVLERHPTLSVAPDVTEWLVARGHGLGRARDRRASCDGGGHFMLDTIAGELDEPLAELAEERGGRLWLPFTRAGGGGAARDPGARLDPRALRCASRLQVGPRARAGHACRSSRATASRASSSTSTGTRRRCRPSSRCPPARRTAARPGRPVPARAAGALPARCSASSRRQRARGAGRPAPRARRRDRRRAPLARLRRPAAGDRGPPRRRAEAVPARRRRLRAAGPAHVPGRRAGPRQDRRGARRARGRRRLPRRHRLPGEPEAQLAARDRALAAAPLACSVGPAPA